MLCIWNFFSAVVAANGGVGHFWSVLGIRRDTRRERERDKQRQRGKKGRKSEKCVRTNAIYAFNRPVPSRGVSTGKPVVMFEMFLLLLMLFVDVVVVGLFISVDVGIFLFLFCWFDDADDDDGQLHHISIH